MKSKQKIRKIPQEPGTFLAKAVWSTDCKNERKIAKDSIDLLNLKTNSEIEDNLTEIIKFYRYESDSEFFQITKVRKTLKNYIAIKEKELELLFKNLDISNYFLNKYDFESLRIEIKNLKKKLNEIKSIKPSKYKGDFLLTRFIKKLLLFRKNLNLSVGYQNDPYKHGDFGQCVSWVTLVINEANNQSHSSASIKERIKVIIKRNADLK